MNRIPVFSSDLRSIAYDSENNILEIEFQSGGIYQYFNVPELIYNALLSAPSKGKFFHHHIKGIFTYRRVR